MTHSRTRIHELLADAGSAPRRDLGQNFVADPNTVRRIAELARVGPGDRVVEIGAGLGSLTLALADTGAEVLAVEVDASIVPVLRDVVGERSNVTVVEGDAMALDWDVLLDEHGGPDDTWTLVANLPYNVATPLVCDLLDEVPRVVSMLVMVQREVAERLAAPPGNKQYGAVSVKVAYWASASVAAKVPASVFVPKPNVESALARIDRRSPPDVAPEPLFALVRTAFGQRRKMLRRSLSDLVTPEQFERADVRPDERPEQLDLDAWCRLTEATRS